MAKAKQDRFDYMITRVGNMLRWLIASGTITFLLTQLSDWVTGAKMSPEIATGLMISINTLLFAVRSYVEGEQE
jgi:hypothetical protein